MKSIDINAFTGMNDVKPRERLFVAEGVAEPKMVLNADITEIGTIEIREGQTLRVNLPGANSLWAGSSCMLCAAGNTLYRIAQDIATQISSMAGVSPELPLSYVEAEGKVYMSNRHWQGVYDPETNIVSSWGIPLPPGPMLLSGSGNLPPGIYRVCFTSVSGNELSGNGPITTIELTEEGGIEIFNRPAGATVWVTDPNESVFYSAGSVSKIDGPPQSIEPLPSFLCSPPPYLENLCYAFGRIWGASGRTLYYSEPFNLSWFKLQANRFEFGDDITLIAKVPTGLFIGLENKTWFLAGTEPTQMVQSDAGAGSIPGTLAYCNNLPELGDILGTPEKGYVDVPVWRTREGIVAGNPAGRLFNLTKNKVQMGIPPRGASLYRESGGGVFQFMTSAKHSEGVGFSDTATVTVLRNGKLITE